MSRVSLSRKLTVSVAFLFAGVVGFAARQAWPQTAHAQMGGSSTIYVPPEGLIFRTLDGKAVARLSRGEFGGGVFELFDDNQRATMRFSASSAVRLPPPPAEETAEAPTLLGRVDPFEDRF